ncbi:MAG: SGNH/GDSL hydrolase family protein [Pseudobdellovibrionaceae bacterium]|nr:SGNH/GDSL hydrolase family protein [Pseudobdellovibrionaceae bacterium]
MKARFSILSAVMIFAACSNDKRQDGNSLLNNEKQELESIVPAKRKVNKMAIVGDSISTGILSNTTLGVSPIVDFTFATGFDVNFGDGINLQLSLLEVLDPLGNSSSLYEKVIGLQNQYVVKPSSFFGGVDLEPQDGISHASRLGLSSPSVLNLSKIGSGSADVLDSIISNENNLVDADYVVLEAGSNDFCNGTQNAEQLKTEFKENFTSALDRIKSLPGKPIVLVNSIPNIPDILKITKSSNAVTYAGQSIQCEVFHNLFCPRLATPENEAESRVLLTDLNQIIQEAVAATQLPNQIILDNSFEKIDFAIDDFSVDCFHPSLKGHKKISDLTFEKVKDYLETVQ